MALRASLCRFCAFVSPLDERAFTNDKVLLEYYQAYRWLLFWTYYLWGLQKDATISHVGLLVSES